MWPQVSTYIASTFLQSLHYELCVLHTGNLRLVNRWLSLAEDALVQADETSARFLSPKGG
jgi:hypothetical protein